MIWLPAAIVVTICIIIAIVRVFIGPGAPTRLVAFDTVNTLVVAIMVILAILFEQVVFVDVAIVYGVLSFIMTLYVARFIEGKKF
ncbi:MAG: cation:proton antiporter [Dehalococcoidia bacterium SG8_51_3]|nr:MAG: cation:proton antiporter [Dehalococcoidia bacterium SG8_51_3]